MYTHFVNTLTTISQDNPVIPIKHLILYLYKVLLYKGLLFPDDAAKYLVSMVTLCVLCCFHGNMDCCSVYTETLCQLCYLMDCDITNSFFVNKC